jgi:hypothetical protein
MKLCIFFHKFKKILLRVTGAEDSSEEPKNTLEKIRFDDTIFFNFIACNTFWEVNLWAV